LSRQLHYSCHDPTEGRNNCGSAAEAWIIDWILIISLSLGTVLLLVLLAANYRRLFLLPPRTLYKLLSGRRVDGEETQSLVDALIVLAFMSFLLWYLLR
jgi:hypothetical protein